MPLVLLLSLAKTTTLLTLQPVVPATRAFSIRPEESELLVRTTLVPADTSVVALILPVICRVAPPEAGAAPIPILEFMVSAINRLLEASVFWIWKAVRELVLSLNNALPPAVRLLSAATVVLPFKPTMPVPVAKVLAPDTLVFPVSVMPPEPDWTVVRDVPLVEPTVVE
jgi:hypothetical protein